MVLAQPTPSDFVGFEMHLSALKINPPATSLAIEWPLRIDL